VRYDKNYAISLAYPCSTRNNLSNGIRFIGFGEEIVVTEFAGDDEHEERRTADEREAFWRFPL
jgi:hypothetical protein